ncbi:MAG: dihydrouridine synthase DuS [Proteobacteria bacterium]|nr:dihydrouridine synthase DuS [Pseudomonadota bacterium]
MDGLADCVLREVLTRIGGYDGTVSEFIRVSGSLLPHRTFLRVCPELANASRTRAGTPVVVQLLGSDPQCMAQNAAQLAELSPAGVDLNFGCPAPTVNRHGGGATLLGDPELIGRIAAAVRQAVSPAIPVSAKMRLGVSDTARAIDCALALAAGGVSSLVVHARTRDDGYRPPAHWEWVAKIREAVSVPVIANGEVWSAPDYQRCRQVTGCDDVMIGRGAVADPFLARRIRALAAGDAISDERGDDWLQLLPALADFWRLVQLRVEARHAPGRLKLWLNCLRRTFVEADSLYLAVRPLRSIEQTAQMLESHGIPVSRNALPRAA